MSRLSRIVLLVCLLGMSLSSGAITSAAASTVTWAPLPAGSSWCHTYPIALPQSTVSSSALVPLPDPSVAPEEIATLYPDSMFTLRLGVRSSNVNFLAWDSRPTMWSADQLVLALLMGGTLSQGVHELPVLAAHDNILRPGDTLNRSAISADVWSSVYQLISQREVLVVPTFDSVVVAGSDALYHISGFASVRLVSYSLSDFGTTLTFALVASDATYLCLATSSPDTRSEITTATPTVLFGTPASYSWSWGDGSVTTAASASHRYAAAGGYALTATITDSSGRSARATAPILINPALQVAASAPYVDVALRKVCFVSTVIEGVAPYSYTWMFDDGTMSASQNPCHVYPANTSYKASLTVSDSLNRATTVVVPVSLLLDTGTTE